MRNTIGERIAALRKEKGMTQEALAEKLGVSGQAVSKWETAVSYPDICLLSELSDIFGVTTDEILSGKKTAESFIVPQEKRKSVEELMLIIKVVDSDGDKITVNLPLVVLKMGSELALNLPQLKNQIPDLKGIDFSQIILMAENGMLGKLVEMEDKDGDKISIYVE